MSDEISHIDVTQVSEYTAHNILNYCLTQAFIKNKNVKFKVQLPYAVLAKSIGISDAEAIEFEGVSLELTATMKWTSEDSSEVEID